MLESLELELYSHCLNRKEQFQNLGTAGDASVASQHAQIATFHQRFNKIPTQDLSMFSSESNSKTH